MTAARLAGACAVALLAGCGGLAPSDPAPHVQDNLPAPPRLMPAGHNFEQRLRERATTQGRQGRLAEAAVSWEILTVLRPDSIDYGDRLRETRRVIAAAVPERLERGAAAHKRGDLDVAAAQYLAALALQPDHAQAADALRQIERERNRRSYLGKPSRNTLTRRAATEAQMAALPPERAELEHAAMLGAQGELDDAIVLLERTLSTGRRDAAGCQMLSEMYYQKAEKQVERDKSGAVASLEKSLRVDGANARAATRLRQLRGGATAVSPISMATPSHGCTPTR